MFNSADFVHCSTVLMKMCCEDVITNEDYTQIMDKLNEYCISHNIKRDTEQEVTQLGA